MRGRNFLPLIFSIYLHYRYTLSRTNYSPLENSLIIIPSSITLHKRDSVTAVLGPRKPSISARMEPPDSLKHPRRQSCKRLPRAINALVIHSTLPLPLPRTRPWKFRSSTPSSLFFLPPLERGASQQRLGGLEGGKGGEIKNISATKLSSGLKDVPPLALCILECKADPVFLLSSPLDLCKL